MRTTPQTLSVDVGAGKQVVSLNIHRVLSEMPPTLLEECSTLLERWRRNEHSDNDEGDEGDGCADGRPQYLARTILEQNLGTSTIASLTLMERPEKVMLDSITSTPSNVAAATSAAADALCTPQPHVIASIVREKLPQISEQFIRVNHNVCMHSSSCTMLYQLPVVNHSVFVSNSFETDDRVLKARAANSTEGCNGGGGGGGGGGGLLPPGHVAIHRLVVVPIFIHALPVGRLVYANATRDYTVEDVTRFIQCAYTLWPFVVMRLITLFCSRRVELEQRLLRQQVDMTKTLEVAKDSFFATLSHELRTPLNGIVVMTRMLRDQRDTFTPKLQGYIDILSQCSLQMLEWINDILDYSKLASNRFKLNPTNVSLETIVEQSLSVGGSLAQIKGLTIRKVIHNEVPKLVRADAKRIQQILVNLLSNAVTFTDSGEIILEIAAIRLEASAVDNVVEADAGADAGASSSSIQTPTPTTSSVKWRVEIRVVDQGCGVSAEDREKIFEVFSHATLHPAEMAHRQGTGLGLAIARNLARLMDGDIRIESNPIRGSTFIVNLTLYEELDIHSLLNNYIKQMSGKRVLIVDDKEDNRIYLANLAFEWSLLPTICSSATEALLYVENQKKVNSNSTAYDIYWIDIQMKGLNGIELAQRLRQLFGNKVPIVGLSSIGSEIHGKEVFDVFETKPVDNYSLLVHTTRLLFSTSQRRYIVANADTAAAAAAAAASAAASASNLLQYSKKPRRHSVHESQQHRQPRNTNTNTNTSFDTHSDSESSGLVVRKKRMSPRTTCDRDVGVKLGDSSPFVIYAVEDDVYNRVILSTLLEKVAGCENIMLELFETGEEIVSRVEHKMPHACLIDLKLSTAMTGHEVVKLIREQCQRSSQPLPTMIAVTASVLDSDKQQCSVSGFDYHVGKPIDVDYFWSLISTIVTRRQ